MRTFRNVARARSAMFAVSYDDGRTAYMIIEHHDKVHDHLVGEIAKKQQVAGTLPSGHVTKIKRVR